MENFINSDILDQFKTQEMSAKAVDENRWCFRYVPDQSKTQEMCYKVVTQHPLCLEYVPDQYKSKEMCSDNLDI